MLGAAEADALGTEVAGELGVLGVVGVGAHTRRGTSQTDLVGPVQDGVEVAGELGRTRSTAPRTTIAGGAVDGDDVALVEHASVPATATSFSAASIFSASTPQTQGAPMPRAITAAWLVLPPWLVRMPSAATMP